MSKLSLYTAHPTSIPLLTGSALIVSTDDHTSTDILLVVTDISLFCLMTSVSEWPSTVQFNTFPIPSQVKLASLYSGTDIGEGAIVMLAVRRFQ